MSGLYLFNVSCSAYVGQHCVVVAAALVGVLILCGFCVSCCIAVCVLATVHD